MGENPDIFLIFNLSRGELLIVVAIQKEGEHKATLLAGLCSADSSPAAPSDAACHPAQPLANCPLELD